MEEAERLTVAFVEDEEEESSISIDGPYHHHHALADHTTSSSVLVDPLMVQEGAVESVVLTSMEVGDQHIKESDAGDRDRSHDEGKSLQIHTESAETEAPTFGLIHFNGDGVLGSEVIMKEEDTEMSMDAVGATYIKEEIITGSVMAEVEEHHHQGQSVLTTEEVNEGHSSESVVAVGEDVSLVEQPQAQQFIILTRNDGGIVSMDDLDGSNMVAQRYIQIEGSDGQTYFLPVAAEESVPQVQPSEPVKQFSSQQIVPTTQVIRNSIKSTLTASASVASSSSPSPAPLSSTTSSSSSSSNPVVLGGKKTSTDNINQAWFTSRDDKNALHKEGHEWKQGQWTKEEIDILKTNIDNYCKDYKIEDPTEVIFEMSKDERKNFYRTVAMGLQRPLFSVYRRVTRMYDRKNHRGKYTPVEINNLRSLRAQHGNDWAAIGQALGRSASSVKDKCRLMKDNCNSGKWFEDEEKRLAAAVYKLTGMKPSESVTTGLSWASVAEHVGSRSEKQCRTKWLNYLNWKQQGGADWTREDDTFLIDKVCELNVNNDSDIDWVNLAKDWSSVRSPQWLRGKWWALKRHVADYNKMGYSDLLSSMKKVLSWNVKAKNGFRTIKQESKDMSSVSNGSGGTFMKNCIPVSLTDASGTSLALSYCSSEEEACQYEVLEHWTPQVISQVSQDTVVSGTQVTTNSAGQLIVQTIGDMSGGSVIISGSSLAPALGKAIVTQPITLHLNHPETTQTDQEMGVLTDSDNLHDATSIGLTFEPGVGQDITTVSEYSNQCQVGDQEHLMAHNVFEAVSSQSGSDLVLATSPTHSTHSSRLMTSLKDPILMSSSSDADCDKSQNTLSDEH